MAVSFIGGENQITRRKPTTCRKSHKVVSSTHCHEWCCHFYSTKSMHECESILSFWVEANPNMFLLFGLIIYICLLGFHWFLSLTIFFFLSVGFTTRVIHIFLWFYCWHYIMYWRKNYARGLIFFFYFQFDTIFVRDSSTRTCIKNNVAHERTSKNLSCQHELDHICTIVVTPTISVT